MSFLRAKSPEAPRITIADPVIVLKVSILPSLARQARPGQARPGQARPGQARPGQAPPRFRRFAGSRIEGSSGIWRKISFSYSKSSKFSIWDRSKRD